MKTLVIDANNLGYMSYYSVGGLSVGSQNTGVIYGFLKKVLQLAKEFETNKFIFCWDSKTNYRKRIYPEYKQKRWDNLTEKQKKERLIVKRQFKKLRREVLPRLGFYNNYVIRGFESDDLMASIVIQNDGNFIIVSSDNDMYQCLDCCSIYNLSSNKYFTYGDFYKKYKIDSKIWPLAKAIGGCSSDNVIGVKGCSDPKNESSKVLKYLRRELNSGVIYNRIEEFQKSKEIERNLKLVKLPYYKFKRKIILLKDDFSKGEFIRVFDQYKFLSFIKNIKEWKKCFLV